MSAFDPRHAYALGVFEADEDGEESDPARQEAVDCIDRLFPDFFDDPDDFPPVRCGVCDGVFEKDDRPALVYVAVPMARRAGDGRATRIGPICDSCAELPDAKIAEALAAWAPIWAKGDAEGKDGERR